MNPLTGFIAIVSLISNYAAERRAFKDEEFQDFTEWLQKNNHSETLNYILENHTLLVSIQSLLNDNNDALNDNFSYLDQSLTRLASKIDGFQEIVSAISPKLMLSDQAISILTQIKNSNCEYMLELSGTNEFFFSNSGLLEIKDIIFFEDDLNSLIELDLIRLSHNNNGKRKFHFTRAGAHYLENVDIKTE